MKTPKYLMFILLSFTLLLTSCTEDLIGVSGGAASNAGSNTTSDSSSEINVNSAVNTPEDLPEGDGVIEVQWVTIEDGTVHVGGLSGNYSQDEGFCSSSDDVYIFKLCGDEDGFEGNFWGTDETGFTSRTIYYGANDFYTDYYKLAINSELFYPVACSYVFNESGELTELYECADLTNIIQEPESESESESDEYGVLYYFDYSCGLSDSYNYWTEYKAFTKEEYSDDAIIQSMSELTGLDFVASVSIVDGRYTVDWSPESTLVAGLDDREHKVAFAVHDQDSMRWFMMDSLARTLQSNTQYQEIYFTMDGGKELSFNELSPVNTIPSDMPYMGSAYYFAQANPGGNGGESAISLEEAMDILSEAINMTEGTAIIYNRKDIINGEECWMFSYGENTPEKFTATEHFAVTGDGKILKMDFSLDGQYVEYIGN